MAEPSPNLSTLIQGLRKASSPWERLGIVTRGAKSLARLSPEKRRELLRRVGLSAADDLVGHLAADAGPETRQAIHRALDRLEQDPEASARLLRELADPATRDVTLGGLIAHLEEVVTEAPEDESAVDSRQSTAGEEPFPAAGSEQEAEKPPDPAADSRAESEEQSAVDRRQSTAGGQGEPKGDEERGLAGNRRLATFEGLLTVVDVEALAALEEIEGPAEATAKGVSESLNRRVEELERRLREVPHAWARRRVLDRTLRGDLGEDLERALDLVERHVEPKERFWCLTTLAASHSRSADDWDRLIAAAGSEATRRRLEMRRRRSTSPPPTGTEARAYDRG